MEQSQDLSTTIVAKRRGRKPKAQSQAMTEQESTQLDNWDSMKSESERTSKRKSRNDDTAPKSISEDRRVDPEPKRRKIRFGNELSDLDFASQSSSEGSDKGEKDVDLLARSVPSSSYGWLGLKT